MVIRRDITLTWCHQIRFTRGAFSLDNRVLVDLLKGESERLDRPARVLVFYDDQLPLEPANVEAYFARHPEVELVTAPLALPGGEAVKNSWAQVEAVWEAIHQHQLCRHSYVMAIGGGAILDLVGFAAATAHRGIRHVRMPTTTLSQGDGGVGVKNGVNYFGKKNWVGSFAVPHAVVNDLALLESLPDREKRAGLIEAVKVALVRDRAFFESIEALAPGLHRLEMAAVEEVVKQSAYHHVEHIATSGDPFELGSARPLDFGHWAAHKLEQLTDFRLTHGEAVAVGMAIDLLYSVDIGLLDQATADRVLKLIVTLGFDLQVEELEKTDAAGRLEILRGLEEFREHLGGELTVTLVPEVGRKVEVHEMDEAAVERALRAVRKLDGVTCDV